MKHGRQSVILDIISQKDIETQAQLMEALAERGIKSTQATLSRDIKDMRLVKELGPHGGYRYVAPSTQEKDDLSPRLKTIFRESLVSYDVAQNIIVIKTLPGLASACCSAIDNMAVEGGGGPLAGGDTPVFALRGKEGAHLFFHEIELLF